MAGVLAAVLLLSNFWLLIGSSYIWFKPSDIGTFLLLNDLRGLSLLLPIIIFLITKGSRNVVFKRIIFLFFCLSIFNELLNNFTYVRYPAIFNLNGICFAFIKILLICLVFRSIATTSLLRTTAIYGYIIYAVALFLFWLFFADSSDYNKTPSSFQSLLLLVLSILFYYEQIKKPEALFIYALPEFWYVTGVFLHASGTFFIFIFAKLWLADKSYVAEYTIIHSGLSIINNLFISFAIWKQFKDPSLVNSKPITA